jgi:hypothetical protein
VCDPNPDLVGVNPGFYGFAPGVNRGNGLRGVCTIGVIVYPSKADYSLRISWQESRKLLDEKPEM